jgi:hypothetical protein
MSEADFDIIVSDPPAFAKSKKAWDCFPICVTDLTSVVSSYETSQQERKSDGHIKSRHQTQGF